MISSVEIKNFQCYKDITLELSKGLNVITGNTHNGKSAIIRPLKWLIKNKPRGDEFKSYFADKKDSVSVKVRFDCGAAVTREKGSENCYIVEKDGKEERYKALGSDVPQEVQSVINMNDANIQSQGDGYFMLADSPGTRAKILNKIVGLDIIDAVTKRANSIISSIKNRIDIVDEDIKKVREELKSFKNLNKIDSGINRIEKLYSGFVSIGERFNSLSDITDSILDKQEEKEEIEEFLKTESSFEEIKSKFENAKSIRDKSRHLKSAIIDLLENKDKLKKIEDALKMEEKVLKIDSLIDSLANLNEQKDELKDLCERISEEKKYKDQQEKIINELSNELNKIKVCPTCDREIDRWLI